MEVEESGIDQNIRENPEGIPGQSTRPNRFLFWVVALLVPVAIVLTAMRLMMTTTFLKFEYNSLNFPADPYGFTTQDRLSLSQFPVNYLLNSADISYLGDLIFENGTPQYNQRELLHMVDVKQAVRVTQVVRYFAYIALLVLWIWASRAGWMTVYTAGLARGGWLTVGLIAVLLSFVFISFGVFFVAFHNVFFEPGTWVFNYSDTLIRLFPERFWRDIFIYVGLLSMAGGLLLGFGFRSRT